MTLLETCSLLPMIQAAYPWPSTPALDALDAEQTILTNLNFANESPVFCRPVVAVPPVNHTRDFAGT